MASNHGRILARVARKALSNAEIYLSTKVAAIESHGGPENPRVVVQTNDSVLEFDEVVVTVPLGCLKRNMPTFSPPLPTQIIRAIQNTSYSRLEKVYIAFPAAFWDFPTSNSSKTTFPATADEFSGAKSSASTDTTIFPCFAHFLHPNYSPSNPSSWTLELNTLSSNFLFGTHAQPTLLFTIYGPCATYLTSQLTPLSTTSAAYLTLLATFFEPYYSLLPSYSSSDPNCIPTAALATNWQNDELAGHGSYMNFQVSEDVDVAKGGEEVRLEDDIRALRASVPEKGWWLAGEHTAPFVALGTATGAYWSGEAVGMRVLAANGLTSTGQAGEGVGAKGGATTAE